SLRSAARDAFVAASVHDANRGKAFGLEGLGDNLGAFVGTLIAVFLLTTVHVQLRAVFYLATIPGLLAVCMNALIKEIVSHPANERYRGLAASHDRDLRGVQPRRRRSFPIQP